MCLGGTQFNPKQKIQGFPQEPRAGMLTVLFETVSVRSASPWHDAAAVCAIARGQPSLHPHVVWDSGFRGPGHKAAVLPAALLQVKSALPL